LVVATGENGYTPKENEEFYGIWINPEYNTRTLDAKILIKPDGTFYEYSMTKSDSWGTKGEYKINEKWTDAEGDIWYKVTFTAIYSTYTYYELVKISKSGTVKESVHTINPPVECLDTPRISSASGKASLTNTALV
jgi:hypothetical protein